MGREALLRRRQRRLPPMRLSSGRRRRRRGSSWPTTWTQDEGGFKLEISERVAWSDASLGCPQEGMGYAQIITPGYRLTFDLVGTSYAVHTNSDGSHMVICGDGQ